MCADICAEECVHPETVEDVMNRMTDGQTAYKMAEIFKVLSDVTRINILSALSISELCVCDIAAALGMGRTAISHQLRVLRQARLVRTRRDGKVVYYALDDDHVSVLFGQVLEHINE